MNKEEILIALKEIHARYCIPASEQNYTDKDYACMQYEKLIIHLQKEIDRLNNLNKQLVEECQRLDDEETRLNNIISELEKWLIKHIDEYRDMEQDAMFEFGLVLDKLKALKENNKDAC